MDIRLDNDVVARGGHKVGTVDKIVIHPETMDIEAMIVHAGVFFTTDRIVELEMIDHIDSEGSVHLKLSKEQEEELPPFVSTRFVEPRDDQYDRLSQMDYWMMPTGTGRVLFATETYDPRYAPASDSMFQPASPEAPVIHEESNLPEGTVVISEGTDVIDRTGDKIGTVDDVVYGSGDHLEAIVVSSGLIFKNKVRIPASWIATATHERIEIDRSAEDVERAADMG